MFLVYYYNHKLALAYWELSYYLKYRQTEVAVKMNLVFWKNFVENTLAFLGAAEALYMALPQKDFVIQTLH